jgi:hypothetical protein
MTTRVKYIGTVEPFSEIGITGEQQGWQINESGYVSDANAALMIASGKFALVGSGVATDPELRMWALAGAFHLVSATRNGDGAITVASIVWPDGTPGVFTGTPSTAALGSVDAWMATYAGTPVKTVTQPTVTRDTDGNVTGQPYITVA